MPCNTADAVKSPLPKAGLTGGDLAKELLAIRRNLPIILCTGFSEIITKEKAKAIGIREFIMKPIVVQEVGGVIRRVLDQLTDD
jgi:FixJ family two-component response regulator